QAGGPHRGALLKLEGVPTGCPVRTGGRLGGASGARGRVRQVRTAEPSADSSAGSVADPAEALLAALRARHGDGRITHVERLPARAGTTAPWPAWVPEPLRQALAERGVDAPWHHQAEAADLAWRGRHVVVATGTASGKSLAYLLPVLSTLLTDPRATALYLAPTKALAADQLRAVQRLGLPGVRAACYDGDTPREEREWIRAHATLVLTNPDMLHWGVLPGHRSWR